MMDFLESCGFGGLLIPLFDTQISLLCSLSLSLISSGPIVVDMLCGSRPDKSTSIFHSENSNLVLSRSSKSKKGQVSLVKLCRDSIPSRCSPNRLLFNGHLQTIWTVLKSHDVPVYYKRKVFESNDDIYPGHFAVDFVVPPYDLPDDPEVLDTARRYTLPDGLPSRTVLYTHNESQALSSLDSKPMLVVLHGLCGGSHEEYLRHVLAALTADGRWEACVLNARGCSQTKITSGVLYHSAATWDLRQTVQWWREKFPNRPLFGIGFSLGANILANVSRLYLTLDNQSATRADCCSACKST